MPKKEVVIMAKNKGVRVAKCPDWTGELLSVIAASEASGCCLVSPQSSKQRVVDSNPYDEI